MTLQNVRHQPSVSDLVLNGRVDGYAKVSGAARYTADVSLPGMLYGAVVRSPYPHARIRNIRTDKARALPGVHAVLTAEDVRYGTFGRRVRDMPVLARGEVRFVGERVAAVAAETPQLAEQAAALVEVEYEPLPAVLDPEQALQPEAPRVHEAPWQYPGAAVTPQDPPNVQSRTVWTAGGDVESALAASARVFEHTFRTPAVHQGYLEPHACVARVGEGGIEVWASNKSPHRLRHQLAACLGVPPERIQVHPVFIGGDFGGKGSPMDVPLCIALAEATGRPVKLRMRYAEDLMAANPRHPSLIRVRLGVDREGYLTALEVRAVLDGGAYAAFKPVQGAQLQGIGEAGNCYRIPAVRIESLIVYTHSVPKGHMRAPGSPQVNFAVESLLDMAARELGIDPIRFRAQNLLKDGDRGTLGERWVEFRSEPTLRAALEALARSTGASNRLASPTPLPPTGPSNPSNFSTAFSSPPPACGDWARGVGIALYHRGLHAGETEVAVEPHADGSVTVWVPFPDQGGGQLTVARNVARRELGLPADRIRVRQGSTRELAVDSGVGGSWVTVTASTAVARACRELVRRLRELGLPERPSEAEVAKAVAAFAGRFPGERVRWRLAGEPLPEVTSFCAQIARVRVDRGTGQVVVEEIITAVDVADVINPNAHRAQIEGGVVMGYGMALLEDLGEEEGRVTAANLGDYKLPSVRDVPRLTTVLVPGARGVGELNVKPIGEVTNVAVPAAIANAVADAVGVRIDSLPITAEKVYRALHPEEVRP